MCVFVQRPIENCHFSTENADLPKKLVGDFLGEKHIPNKKIMEIFNDFVEKSYNNNGNPWKSSRILRVKTRTYKTSSEISHLFLHFFILKMFKQCFYMFPSFFLVFLFSFFCFSPFLLFSFSFFSHLFFFFFFFFLFQSSEQTPKPAKNRRWILEVKKRFSFVKI